MHQAHSRAMLARRQIAGCARCEGAKLHCAVALTERRHEMAKKKAAKKKAKKPQRRQAATKKARKSLRRSTGATRRAGETRGGGGGRARKATRKSAARKATRKTAARKGPARKAVRSGRTTARKTRKREDTARSERATRGSQAGEEPMTMGRSQAQPDQAQGADVAHAPGSEDQQSPGSSSV